MTIVFPKDFLWGIGGSGHQTEGDNVNSDCWVMENVASTMFVEPSGSACDHYHRYADDIALIAKLGLNAYRFSFEWSRIEPEKGMYSLAALDHYKRVLQCCHYNGLTPVVTFNHFTSPRWFAGLRGFEVATNNDHFVDYVDRTMRHMADLIPIAATFNEPNIGLLLQFAGVLPGDDTMLLMPSRQEAAQAIGCKDFAGFPFCQQTEAPSNMIAAHLLASKAIKSHNSNTKTGLTLATQDIVPGAGAVEKCAEVNQKLVGRFLPALKNDDFIGAQIYTRLVIGPDGKPQSDSGTEFTQAGQPYCPEATKGALLYLKQNSDVPILITENGVATSDDARRIDYIDRALAGVHRAIKQGVEVLGYCHWSAFDSYEWNFGYGPHYGVIAVDRTTMERTPKASAYRLGKISQANAA